MQTSSNGAKFIAAREASFQPRPSFVALYQTYRSAGHVKLLRYCLARTAGGADGDDIFTRQLRLPLSLAARTRAVLEFIGLILFVRSPSEMARMNAAKMPIATAMGSFVGERRWRRSCGQNQHQAMGLNLISLPDDKSTVAGCLMPEGPQQTLVSIMANMILKPLKRRTSGCAASLRRAVSKPTIIVGTAPSASVVTLAASFNRASFSHS